MKTHQARCQPSLSAAQKAHEAKDTSTPEVRRTPKLRRLFPRTGSWYDLTLLFVTVVVTALGLAALPTPADATHQSFEGATNWTQGVAFYGTDPWTQTFFADVNGDGKADALAVKSDGIRVRYSDGSQFRSEEKLTSSPFSGTVQTAFADVTGDKKADAIAIDRDTITVRRSENKERVITKITEYADDSVLWHYFADIDADGKADLIALTRWGVFVWKSRGDGNFGPIWKWTPPSGFPGEISTHFADVDGDGRADAIAVNYSGISVYLASKIFKWDKFDIYQPFWSPENWTPEGPLYGNRWEFFVDVTGDGKADLVLDNWDGLAVRNSLGTRFAGLENGLLRINGDLPCYRGGYWTEAEFFGDHGGTGFADVEGRGGSAPIAIKSDGLWVRRNLYVRGVGCR
jgi:hypothetical protein